MSKHKPPKKKVVVTTSTQKTKVKPTVSRAKSSEQSSTSTLLFNRQHFMLMGLGAVLVALGLLLMSGGAMDNPQEWNPDIIYSFRRTVLAPIVILAGLAVEVYAIFK